MSFIRGLPSVVVLAISLAALAGCAVPYANWYDTSRLSQANKSLALQFRTYRAFHTPQRDEALFPRYPDAELFIGNIIFRRTGFVSLSLVSRSPVGKVLEWYKRRLPDVSTAEMNGPLVKGFRLTRHCETSEGQTHPDQQPMDGPYIVILHIPKGMKPLTVGYRTIIEMRYKPGVPW